MSRRRHAPDELRIQLAYALGFLQYPTSASPDPEPYLNYITNRYVGRGTLEVYLKLVIHVIEYFKVEGDADARPTKTIQSLIDDLANGSNESFRDTQAGSPTRRDVVEDTVMYVIGIWTLLMSSFVHLPIAGGARKITLAYNVRAQETSSTLRNHPYDQTVSSLLTGSGLLPAGQWDLPLSGHDSTVATKTAAELLAGFRSSQDSSKGSISSLAGSVHSMHQLDSNGRADTRMPLFLLDDLDSLESLHVAATRLNAYTLSVFRAIDIAWTHNISRHMLLCKRNGRHVLEIFALPCAINAATLTSNAVGISHDYAHEITESYSILFNAWSDTPRHAKPGKLLGARRFCWCWSCSAHRHRTQLVSEYRKLSEKKTSVSKRCRSAYASEFDPRLVELMRNEPSDWTPELFPSLWPRIMVLEDHLQSAKPWNIWILFRDRRDTLQFWTFLSVQNSSLACRNLTECSFATVVVLLTIVQVILGIAQVIGSFA